MNRYWQYEPPPPPTAAEIMEQIKSEVEDGLRPPMNPKQLQFCVKVLCGLTIAAEDTFNDMIENADLRGMGYRLIEAGEWHWCSKEFLMTRAFRIQCRSSRETRLSRCVIKFKPRTMFVTQAKFEDFPVW